MGRKTRRPVFKVRYRMPGKIFGSKFSFSKNGNEGSKGRILSKRKLSSEEISRIGEYLPFDPKALLREFRESERVKGGVL